MAGGAIRAESSCLCTDWTPPFPAGFRRLCFASTVEYLDYGIIGSVSQNQRKPQVIRKSPTGGIIPGEACSEYVRVEPAF